MWWFLLVHLHKCESFLFLYFNVFLSLLWVYWSQTSAACFTLIKHSWGLNLTPHHPSVLLLWNVMQRNHFTKSGKKRCGLILKNAADMASRSSLCHVTVYVPQSQKQNNTFPHWSESSRRESGKCSDVFLRTRFVFRDPRQPGFVLLPQRQRTLWPCYQQKARTQRIYWGSSKPLVFNWHWLMRIGSVAWRMTPHFLRLNLEDKAWNIQTIEWILQTECEETTTSKHEVHENELAWRVL